MVHNLEDEIKQLKYQFKLMKIMISSDEYPFYGFVLDHHFTEEQTQGLLLLLNIFDHKSTSNNQDTLSFLSQIQAKEKLSSFGITEQKIIDAKVTKNDFEDLLKYLFPENTFETKYLALSLKKQDMHEQILSKLYRL
jgi:hypothetical protein